VSWTRLRRRTVIVAVGLAAGIATVAAFRGAETAGRSHAGPGRSDETRTEIRRRYLVRGVFDRDFSRTGFSRLAALGFNFIDSEPYRDEIRPLAARGLKAFVWLGGYSNATCRFQKSDRWIRSHVAEIARSRGVGAYFVDDEPDAAVCPNAPAQIKARADLIKSIDPKPATFIVTYHVDQLKAFAGTVDVVGLNWYPCSIAHGCDLSRIEQQVAEADRLGIRYWGVIQAHGDDWYKVPTPQELHEQFRRWRQTNMDGYLVFAWHWPPSNRSLWLANHRELQAQLKKENAR
jgi:hypothetical protein